MNRMRILLPAALVVVLGACASRPPEPTADQAPASAPPVASQSGGAGSGNATGNTTSGSNVASGATMPRGHEVFFAFDSSTLSSDAQGIVQQNARYAQPRSAHVRLEGNADERGSREYNLALGQRRAETVRQAMTLSGLRADTVEAVSYGEEHPRCSERTEECFASNRRVDILVAP